MSTEEVNDESRASMVLSPELVFAVVSPVGTPGDQFQTHVMSTLRTYGYVPKWIKLSKIIESFAEKGGRTIDTSLEAVRIPSLMSEGDSLCKSEGSEAAVAIRAVSQMQSVRAQVENDHADKDFGPRIAWILDSLKRPVEVTQLRHIYGDQLVVVSLQATDEVRKRCLAEKIRPQHSSKTQEEIEAIIQALIDRDLDEQISKGQNIVKTFPLADVFIDVSGDVQHQVERVLDLLFRNPDYPVPTPGEYGMKLASITSTRSPELGRKVGAAIMKGGTVISLGFNAHPHDEDSTPAYDPTVADINNLLYDTLSQLDTSVLTDDALRELETSPDAFVASLMEGPLKKAKIAHLTEFQQPVHAEMTAILDAAKQGIPLDECAVYVTTYPCHGCAKHILRLGLPVTYIEPYPKGRAESMYGEAVTESFRPFTGIAPGAYDRFFSVAGDRKLPDGARKKWEEEDKLRARPNVDPLLESGVGLREQFAISQLSPQDG